MTKMTFDKFDEEMKRFEAMDDTSKNHGITLDEMTKMESEPDKYLRYAMYLLTRAPYKNGGDDSFNFTNADAASPSAINYRLDALVQDNIDWVESDDDAE